MPRRIDRAPVAPIDPDLPQDFAARVVAWQRRHGRHGLPWQGTRDAYRIWLSEIMLQQTQVGTVLRYYAPFLQRFPTVADLARAPQDEVLAAWSGLGYYSRARNLHRCAQEVQALHGGVFPVDAQVLATLPGIGRSTAAAVAAFSSGQRGAILDGNVKRVLTRHRAFEDDVARPAGQRRLWALAEALLPEEGIEPYTQGLMDLGATVCLLRRPQCTRCPVQADCAGFAQGRPQDYPVKTQRLRRGVRDSVMVLCTASPPAPKAGPRVLMQRRAPTGIWAGLWSLPLLDDDEALGRMLAAEPQGVACGGTQGGGGPDARGDCPVVIPLPDVQHALTHLDWTLRPRRVHLAPGSQAAVVAALQACGAGELRWMELDEALQCGLPAPVRRLLEAEQALRPAS